MYHARIGELTYFSIYLEFEDIAFYNLSVYHNNLHDKQNRIIIGYMV